MEKVIGSLRKQEGKFAKGGKRKRTRCSRRRDRMPFLVKKSSKRKEKRKNVTGGM